MLKNSNSVAFKHGALFEILIVLGTGFNFFGIILVNRVIGNQNHVCLFYVLQSVFYYKISNILFLP